MAGQGCSDFSVLLINFITAERLVGGKSTTFFGRRTLPCISCDRRLSRTEFNYNRILVLEDLFKRYVDKDELKKTA